MKPSRIVLVLAALIFICNIWGYDLWTPDEPFFGEGAREMLIDGHWVVPHINGVVNTHKPPLFFWLIALFSLPFGEVLSFTARLPSVLASIGTVALTLRMGRRISGEWTAVFAAFVLATTFLVWDKARVAQIDALLCFLIWVALSAFEAWRAGDAGGRNAGLLFWLAAALAVLAKGPVGLLLPLGIAVVTLAFDREIGRWRDFAPLTGPLLFAVICGAWVASTMLWGPAEYSVVAALKEHFVDRGIHGMHHLQPWWYYAKVMPPSLLPWTFLVPGALVLAMKRKNPHDRFLLVAALFVVLFFSISTEKRTLYVLPAFPAFALMTARVIAAITGREPGPPLSRRWITVGQVFLGCFFTILGLMVPFAAQRLDQIPGWKASVIAVLLLATGLVTLWLIRHQKLLNATAIPAVGCTGIYLFVSLFVFPGADTFKSGRNFAIRIKEATAESRAAGHQVMACNLDNLPRAYSFYSNGVYFVLTNGASDLEAHLNQEARVFAVTNAMILDQLAPGTRERLEVIDTTHASRLDVALVANY